MEKRSIRRHAINASTACGHFTASTQGKRYDGKMLNYSSDGMCIESSAKFKKGAMKPSHRDLRPLRVKNEAVQKIDFS